MTSNNELTLRKLSEISYKGQFNSKTVIFPTKMTLFSRTKRLMINYFYETKNSLLKIDITNQPKSSTLDSRQIFKFLVEKIL